MGSALELGDDARALGLAEELADELAGLNRDLVIAIVRESYVNLIPTVNGGTHESGLKDGLFGAIKSFIDLHSLLPKGVAWIDEAKKKLQKRPGKRVASGTELEVVKAALQYEKEASGFYRTLVATLRRKSCGWLRKVSMSSGSFRKT